MQETDQKKGEQTLESWARFCEKQGVLPWLLVAGSFGETHWGVSPGVISDPQTRENLIQTLRLAADEIESGRITVLL